MAGIILKRTVEMAADGWLRNPEGSLRLLGFAHGDAQRHGPGAAAATAVTPGVARSAEAIPVVAAFRPTARSRRRRGAPPNVLKAVMMLAQLCPGGDGLAAHGLTEAALCRRDSPEHMWYEPDA